MTVSIGTEPRVLRQYQIDAVDAVEDDWVHGSQRNGVVMPTGTGKSTIGGEIIRRAYNRGDPVVSLAHRGELVDQMRRDLLEVDPTIPLSDIGIVRAEQDDHHCPIVFATLQTLATARRRKALGKRRVILWDEVHHAGAEGFHTTFSELGGYDDSLMCGLTATMSRADRGRVGLGDVIQKISYERDIRWAIKHGYLVQPRGLTVRIKGLDKLDDVRNVAGDFHQGELAAVMEAATSYVVDAIKLHAADRKPIIFAASVDAAYHIAEALSDAGFPAEAVVGEIGYDDRKPLYEAFRTGETKALVTVQVLTEGADFPMCDSVVLARPTRSRNLYSQMIGRSLRLYPNKTDALVLDLAGSARSMKLVNLTELDTGAEVREVDEDGTEILCPVCACPTYACTCEPEMPSETVSPLTTVRREGPVDMVTIDLLANSDNVWLETPGGVPFMPLLEDGEVIFLWPEHHVMPSVGEQHLTKWAICQMNLKTGAGGYVTGSGRFISEEMDFVALDQAVDNAEVWIVETDQKLPRREARWRRDGKPSDKQVNFARNLGIVLADGMTKAQLSDEISVKLTGRVLDRTLTKRA